MYRMVPVNNNNNGMIASKSYAPITNTCSNFINNNLDDFELQFSEQMQLDSYPTPTPKAQSLNDQFKFPLGMNVEYGNGSPESMSLSEQSPLPSPISQDSEIEMKDHQQQNQKDPQDLTYDEITALLGPNTQIEDFLTQLFEEETKQESAHCKHNAKNEKFLNRRLSVLHSIMQAVKNCNLDPMTGDKAMYYFDKLCAKTEVNKNCFHFAAFICLWIACKYNETANTMPHINGLINAYPKNKIFINFAMNDFTQSEKKIISSLGFRLKCVLPIEFIEYYLHVQSPSNTGSGQYCIFPTDLGYDESTNKLVKIPVRMQDDIQVYTRFFLNMVNENYKLCTTYKPSQLAIAVICCARRAVKITPYFNKDYMLDMFQIDAISKETDECFNELWTDYKNKFPNEAERHKDFQDKSLIDM